MARPHEIITKVYNGKELIWYENGVLPNGLYEFIGPVVGTKNMYAIQELEINKGDWMFIGQYHAHWLNLRTPSDAELVLYAKI